MELKRYIVKNLKTGQYVVGRFVYSDSPEPRIYTKRGHATNSIRMMSGYVYDPEDFEIIEVTITIPDL